MTTQIFIENATGFNFNLVDNDGTLVRLIRANGYYSLKMNYSQSFEKQFSFNAGGTPIYLWLSPEGDIARILPNDQVHLDVMSEEYHTRTQLFPPPLRTSQQVRPNGHLYGSKRNKLLITPINNIYARVTPLVAPYVPDRTTRLDFTP
jgi:hypothetical protein